MLGGRLSTPSSDGPGKPDTIRCPTCGALISREKYYWHAKSRHQEKAGDKRSTSPEEDGEGRYDLRDDGVEEYREGRRLDQTADYWGLREHGRFGSHSSHDDYDEGDP